MRSLICRLRCQHFRLGFVFIGIFFIFGIHLVNPVLAQDQKKENALDVAQAVDMALKVNLALLRSQDEVDAAQSTKNIQRSIMLPRFNTTYSYRYDDEAANLAGIPIASQNEFNFDISLVQPVFRGFDLINQYKIADLGLNAAEVNEQLARLNVIFDIKNAYFSVLKTEKLALVELDAIKSLKAQEEVARNFYEVGMSPLNDLLQVQVQVANAQQAYITAKNNLQVAEAQFNAILIRPLNTPVVLEDIQTFAPLEKDIDYYLDQANKNRLEIKIAELEVQIAEKEVKVAQSDFYPDVDLSWRYFRRGNEFEVDGGPGIFDADGWSIQATASWDFWEWGRTVYGRKEKLSRLSQARHTRDEIRVNVNFEVKQAYLKVIESEKNIVTVEKALVQARENLRINQERYKEQVSTSTDVLIAQTLLNTTRSNYVTALYDFKIAKAALQRAISLEVLE